MNKIAAPKIFQPPERRFWVCRAQSGQFLEHFFRHEVIAMGHIDPMRSLNFSETFEASKDKIEKYFKSKSEILDRTATNHLNQVLHFIADAKAEDLVLTVGGGSILIGKILSDAFFEKKNLYIKKGSGKKEKEVEMTQYLRRKVKWVKTIPRWGMPYSLSKGITGNQTFFNLDGYEDEIYSMISPYVYKKGELVTNLSILREKKISTYHFSKLGLTFLKAEFISKNWESLSQIKTIDELEARFISFCEEGKYDSSLVAEFSSPGRTSNALITTAIGAAIFALILNISLSGGELETDWPVKFKAKTNELIPHESRVKFFNALTEFGFDYLRDWLLKDSKNLQDHLELKQPEGDFEILESPGQLIDQPKASLPDNVC